MSNTCIYALHAAGPATGVDELVARLTGAHGLRFPGMGYACASTIHEADGRKVVEVAGDCAWSVGACMCGHGAHGAPAMTLASCAAELGVDIEAYGTESGLGMAEHFLYTHDGEVAIEEERDDYVELCWDEDEYPTFEEFVEDHPEAEGRSPDEFDEGWLAVGGFDEEWSV